MTKPYTGTTKLWSDWTTTYTLTPGSDSSKPVVVMLHGLLGHQTDFTTGYITAYDSNSPMPPQQDLSWHDLSPAIPIWKFDLDPVRSGVEGWQLFLQQQGFSTVIYSQVDNSGLLARPAQELGWVISDLINNGLAGSGLPANAELVFLAHSRGSLLVRKFLKDHAQDPMLQGRIQRVVTLSGPHQGTLLSNIGVALVDVITALEAVNPAAGGLLGTALAGVGATQQVPAWTEMEVGSAFLTDLANGEQPFPGAVYHTFGGTNVTFTRIRWWLFTAWSYVPQWHWPPFDWQAGCSPIPGWSPVFDCISPLLNSLNVPCPDELTQGKGDILTANARTHLPFSISLSMPLNHGQMQYDPSVQQEVLNILLSPLQGAWQNGSGLLAGQNNDGRLEAFRINLDKTISHNWQASPGGGWSGWSLLGPSAQAASSLIVGQNSNGALEVFALGLDSYVYHNYQTYNWIGWSQIPGGWQGKSLSVGSNADGRLELFLIGTDNNVWHNWQTNPSTDNWSGWNLLGPTGQASTSLMVGQNTSGTLEAFVLGTDGYVYHNWQTSPGGGWSGWNSVPGGWQGKSLSVGRNADGRLELFLIDLDSHVAHNWQTSPGGGWSGWILLGPTAQTASTLIVGQNASGGLEVFALGLDSYIYHNYQTNDWVGWNPVPGGWQSKSLNVGRNADGRLELFVIGMDSNTYHNWQTSPGTDNWSGWYQL